MALASGANMADRGDARDGNGSADCSRRSMENIYRCLLSYKISVLEIDTAFKILKVPVYLMSLCS